MGNQDSFLDMCRGKSTVELLINNEIANKYGFVTSLYISDHPLMKAREKTRRLYFTVLDHFVKLYMFNTEYSNARLLQYRNIFVNTNTAIFLTDKKIEKTIRMIVDDFLKPWKRERYIMLLCDIALIIMDKAAVKKALDMIAKYFRRSIQKRLNVLFEILFNDKIISAPLTKTKNLITQFCANRNFFSQEEIKVMVTANMSAGKSTLINAIVGKPVTRTAQEACTNNLCFLYNKPFEDNRIHLLASSLNLNATYDELKTAEEDAVCNIASFFRGSGHSQTRICLIDTPGANSAVNHDHGKAAREAISDEYYNKLIYVLNACYLGTDDDIKHLKFVYKNVPEWKIIFVLNRLDEFNIPEDSISESIENVKCDLEKIGFKNPVICPLSAYFSLLLKMKQNNEILSEDEQDIYDLYVKKFNRPEYDLSVYYDKTQVDKQQSDDEFLKMSFVSGLYGFEKILYERAK